MMGKRFANIAEELQEALLAEGFTVHRYDALTSNSIYLKLNYGACGSIRISDHEGYGHLHYMWNIGTWIDRERHENHQGRSRHFYPVQAIGDMVEAIYDLRSERMESDDYEFRIELCKYQKETARNGFWAHPQTYLVTKGGK